MSYDPLQQLRDYEGPLPVLSFMQTAPAVKLLIRCLAATGCWDKAALDPDVEVPDVLDGAVKDAVLIFQRAQGLAADGVVGPKTWAALKRFGVKASTPLATPPKPASTPVASHVDVPKTPPLASTSTPASTGHRTINAAGRKLIQSFEGFRQKVYLDAVGKPTVSYGHLLSAAENRKWPVGTKLSMEECQDLFTKDIASFETSVAKAVKVHLNDQQFAACVSLAFNIGAGAFGKSSVLKNINAGKFAAAADHFLDWDKAGGRVLAGLKRRRQAERELFLSA